MNGLALRASSVVELLKAHSSVVGKAKKAADHLQELLVSSTREEQNRMRMLQSGGPAVLAANHGQEWDDGRTRYVTQLAALLDDHIAQLQVRVRLCWRRLVVRLPCIAAVQGSSPYYTRPRAGAT